MFKESKISQRLQKLEQHLKQENPILSEVVQRFRELDKISRRLGYFHREESHATRTPWWPLFTSDKNSVWGKTMNAFRVWIRPLGDF